eukprot:3613800-Pyramimonas_sp.AAC.1
MGQAWWAPSWRFGLLFHASNHVVGTPRKMETAGPAPAMDRYARRHLPAQCLPMAFAHLRRAEVTAAGAST